MPDNKKTRADGEDGEKSRAGPIGRRGVLKATASTAVGATMLGAMSGTAAAGGCSYDFLDCPHWFGEIDVENWSFHNFPWGTSDLTIFIHGFTNENGGRDYAYEIFRNLRDQGWGGDMVNARWNAGDSWDDWYWAKNHSIEAGQRLADILAYYGWTGHNGVNVNLIGHSLGGKMALECVRHLQGHHEDYINSVQLFGAAVYDRATYLEDPDCRFHYPVAYGTVETHNYHSYDDGTLKYAYQSAEGGRHACGYSGAVGEPGNWYDHDFTGHITEHCQYQDYDDGVLWWIDDDL